MAALDNDSASEIDKTSFWWTGMCAICHTGGGPSEYDRDGYLYYDVATDLMGFEARGETDAEQEFDGDYSEVSNQTGLERHPAPWDVTGVAEPDCLFCHRAERTIAAGPKDMNWVWRAATLRGKDALTDQADGLGNSVPAYAAAATAAQGWFSGFGTAPGVSPPKATHLVIDYGVGVADGSLVEELDGSLRLAEEALRTKPGDFSCYGCHTIADKKKRGVTWFDPDKDAHFSAFNRRDDGDLGNDVPDAESSACVRCHPLAGTALSTIEHNFAKGNANLGSARDDTDYFGFNSCRDCHFDGADPEATMPVSSIHSDEHLESMSCQFCHIPFKHQPASLSIDNATSGSTINYNTDVFLSTDPQDPTLGTTDWWYPSATVRADCDGQPRLFPNKRLLSTWWGDWDDKTGDGPSADDLINSIYLWRVRDVIGIGALSATDDNGDGTPEVNTRAEILAYLTKIETEVDVHGNPFVAGKGVLVKGGKVWYLDPGDLSGVNHFEIHGSGIETESAHPFSVDHNVQPISEGTTLGSCSACHKLFNFGFPTDVFDRAILLDAFDEASESAPGAGDGAQPVYGTLREVSGVDPL